MSELLKSIASDLSIEPYAGETSSDYCYRVCYSALAYYLLCTASGSEAGVLGIGKKAQTDVLQRVLEQYEKILGLDKFRFIDDSNNFISHVRRVYEETGYLIVDERNYDVIATYGRTIQTEIGYLYFGIPANITYLHGLGIYTDKSVCEADLFETFLRDTLSVDEYIAAAFNPLDFEERDIDQSGLEFFNPSLKKPPSASWGTEIRARRTLARTSDHNSLFRMICDDTGKLLYAHESFDADKGCLTSYETRRLFIALKEQYGEPVVAWMNQLDENYYEIQLSAQLPTREYYFLLLSAWPKGNAFNKIKFIANTDILPTIERVLNNIGVKTIRRHKYV